MPETISQGRIAARGTSPLEGLFTGLARGIREEKKRRDEKDKQLLEITSALEQIEKRAKQERKTAREKEGLTRKTEQQRFEREKPFKKRPLTLGALTRPLKSATGAPVVMGPGGRPITGTAGEAVGGQVRTGEFLQSVGLRPTGETGTGEITVEPRATFAQEEQVRQRERQLDLAEQELNAEIVAKGLTVDLQERKFQLEQEKLSLEQAKLAVQATPERKGFLGIGTRPPTLEEVGQTRESLFGVGRGLQQPQVSQESRQKAIKFLEDNNALVTEANIKAVIQQFGF